MVFILVQTGVKNWKDWQVWVQFSRNSEGSGVQGAGVSTVFYLWLHLLTRSRQVT